MRFIWLSEQFAAESRSHHLKLDGIQDLDFLSIEHYLG
jgi:hypothetical protein